MGLFDWFRRLGAKAAPSIGTTDSRSPIAGLIRDEASAGNPVDPDNYAAVYDLNPWVRAGVKAIAKACSSVPIKLYDAKDEEVEQHRALEALKYVNAEWDWKLLIKATVVYGRLLGNVYWLLDKPKSPTTIFCLRANKVRIEPGKKGPKYFEYTPGAGVGEKYKPELIIHLREFSPISDWYGSPDLKAIEQSINVDNYIRALNKSHLKRGGVPSGDLSFDGDLTDEELKKVRVAWESAYGGTNRGGRPFIHGKKITWSQTGVTARDGQFILLAKMSREEILAVLGVPPVEVGLETANYATAKEQRAKWWRDDLVPLLEEVTSTLNEQFLPRYDNAKGLRLGFDFSGVEALQEERNQQATRLQGAVGVPYMTPDEAREQVGLTPLGGALDYVYAGYGMMPVGSGPPEQAPATEGPAPKPQEETPPPTAESEGKPAKTIALPHVILPKSYKGRFEPGGVEHWKEWKAFLDSIHWDEARLRKAVGELQLGLLEEVLEKLRAEAKSVFKATVLTPEAILFDLNAAGKVYVRELTPHYERIIRSGASRAIAQIGAGSSWDMGRPEVARWLEAKALQIRTLPNTPYNEIRDILTGIIREGGTIGDMTAQLQALEPGYEWWKAERIARTETVGGNNFGALECYGQNNAPRKGWLTAMDERVRGPGAVDAQGKPTPSEFDHSMPMEAGPVPLEEPFDVSGEPLMYPGDPSGSAGNIISCRCTTVPEEAEGE